ncbi:DUF5789 family protein [Halomicrobium salinisoli]|uniref:DUF5789 family protein n=1 Tax=Halomicrobium salinisoli TaxID=2878391 RepID=UPI001CF0340F|nr:hypothetical protein [Halomicrobium salinisoli]
MADDKSGREKQAADEERRQRKRDMQEARERGDEPEPIEEDADEKSSSSPDSQARQDASERLGDLDEALEDHDYPLTADELIDAHGDRDVETQDGSASVAEVLDEVDDAESYESPDDVRDRIRGLVHR